MSDIKNIDINSRQEQSYSCTSSSSSSPTETVFNVEQRQQRSQLPQLKISTKRTKHTRNRSQTHLRKPASFGSYLSYERSNSISSTSSCESLISTNSNNTPVDSYYNHFSSSSSSSMLLTPPLSPRFISNTIFEICHRVSCAIGLNYFLESLKHSGGSMMDNHESVYTNTSLTEDYDEMDDINTSISRDKGYSEHEEEEEFLFVNTQRNLKIRGSNNSSISILT
ncbi:3561_t:CDS:1 [Ambispora leptoticha]|uniref:3561_t:CDS:1 n=1 Tax=Ambispora leptoticha TaxID=144679 RepID=A0A9N9FHY5_9GLOM|nr:3561_t:CDS:1 [Ambispora leptoticha]